MQVSVFQYHPSVTCIETNNPVPHDACRPVLQAMDASKEVKLFANTGSGTAGVGVYLPRDYVDRKFYT